MQERTIGSALDPKRAVQHGRMSDGQAEAGGAGPDQMTVRASLIRAVMDVDAAVDDGGLELQEALARMHEELAHLIPGEADDPGAGAESSPPPPPEHQSSRG